MDTIYFLSLFINLLFFLIYCVVEYEMLKCKLGNSWYYKWGEYIQVNSRKAIYLNNYKSHYYVIFEWDLELSRVNENNVSFVYKDILKEELKILEEANKLNKQATELYNKVQKKKTIIFNS